MNADSAFYMGSTHAVCQDYAVGGSCNATAPAGGARAVCRPYAILSDGCSSSPDTDIGARLLVKAAERLLRESVGGPPACGLASLHAEAAHLALSWGGLLGLKPQAVDATLLTAHLDGDELVVGCSGDGVICLVTTDGELDVYAVSYPSGYPVYPAYAHQPARMQMLADAGCVHKEVTRLCVASDEQRLRPTRVPNGETLTEVFVAGAAGYKFVVLLSDGVHSFFRPERAEAAYRSEAIPLESVLPGLVSFKNTRGAFVGRRMKNFLTDCRQRGWRHSDDLSLAALHIGD